MRRSTAASLLLGSIIAPIDAFIFSPAAIKSFSNPTFTLSASGLATCINGNVAVTASAQNEKILLASPANQLAVTEVFVEFLQANSALANNVNGGSQTVAGTFNINARLCYPTAALTNAGFSTIQFLIHGIGFDKSYWDVAAGYSYIDAAAAAGYATFSYDRLGVGLSAHPDPIQTVQSFLEVEIAHQLIQSLRYGALAGQNFAKVALAGHSFGAIQSVGIASKYPADADAVTLQGFSLTSEAIGETFADFNSAIASANQPNRFGSLPNGYLVTDSSISNSFAFYRYPNFDSNLFYTLDAQKQTYTLGEVFTLAAVVAPATAFTGPVDVVLGQNDFIFCQGDCTYPTDLSAQVQPALFPAASAGSQHYLVPGVGHAVNSHYNATLAYKQMIAFLKANNL